RPLPKDADPRIRFAFPSPEALAGAKLEELGLTRSRSETLRTLAKSVSNGKLDLETPRDLDGFVNELCLFEGIGDWTAQYVALRALGEPDAFPASDLGLLRSPASGGVKGPRELLARAESWRPWRGYAAIVLWRAYGVAAEANGKTRRRVVEKESARVHSRPR